LRKTFHTEFRPTRTQNKSMYDLKVNKCTSTIAESQNVLRIEKDIYQFNIITNMCPKFFFFFFSHFRCRS